MKEKYMMATKATHKMGDISSDEPDLCIVFEENEDNYIGQWVTGFGFVVEFPKTTTKELSKEDIDKYNGMKLRLPWGRIQTLKVPKEKVGE